MIGEKEEEIERLKKAATENESEIRERHSEELDTEKKRVSEATRRAAQAEERETERQANVRKRSQKIAWITVRGIAALTAFVALVVNIVWNPSPDAPLLTRYGLYGLAVLLGGPSIIGLIIDKDITYIFRRIEPKIASHIESYLQRVS